MTQLTGWLTQSRSVYQGAYQTQAQVMSTLGADSGNIAQLLQQSGKSSGALDAIQAGNLWT
jgi:conjugal transfer/entry exclusion protein